LLLEKGGKVKEEWGGKKERRVVVSIQKEKEKKVAASGKRKRGGCKTGGEGKKRRSPSRGKKTNSQKHKEGRPWEERAMEFLLILKKKGGFALFPGRKGSVSRKRVTKKKREKKNTTLLG